MFQSRNTAREAGGFCEGEAAPVGEALGPGKGRSAEAEFRAHAEIRVAAGIVIGSVRQQRPLWASPQHHMVQRPRHVVILQSPKAKLSIEPKEQLLLKPLPLRADNRAVVLLQSQDMAQ